MQDDYQITIKNPSVPNVTPAPKLPLRTLDDTGNAERMKDAYGKHLRYNYTDKRWMYYKDGKWHYDDRGMVYVAADGVLERMKQELRVWTEHEDGKFLQEYGLVSNYTIKQFKVHKSTCNEEKIANEVDRKFNDRDYLEVVVSDLTYVRVRDKWCYVCILIDLFNREIIGYSAGTKKNAELVYDAFLSSSVNLSKIRIFHTDRGSEFKNKIIDEIITTFNIKRSLSHKGCPYDNAVSEATYKVFKTEFVMNNTFNNLDELKFQLADYVHWFNNVRIHGSLGYLSPVQFKNSHPAK